MSTREILAGAVALVLALGRSQRPLSADRPALGQPVSRMSLRYGTSALDRMAEDCPPAAARLPRARLCTRRNANVPRERGTRRDQRRALTGPQRTVANYVPHATTIFDFTRRAMPWQQPKSLTNDEVYAVMDYILSLNKIIGENDVLNAEDLTEGADAGPRWLHQQIPRQTLATVAVRSAVLTPRPATSA